MPLHTDDLPPCPAGARCVPDLLASAADLIDGGGLAKHRRSGPGPALSVEGAIQAAYRLKGADPEHHGMGPVLAAIHEVRTITGDRTVEQWSDHAHRHDVVAKLRELASDTRTRGRAR